MRDGRLIRKAALVLGNVRSGHPERLRAAARRYLHILYRSAIVRVRTPFAKNDPSFLLVGGQRCGTTSLASYLATHAENLSTPICKEIGFFDGHYERGMTWYRAHFPITDIGQNLTGDATPQYLDYPACPRRVFDAYPRMKFVVLLRNPVVRAYSHYTYNLKRLVGAETLSFREALEAEEERLGPGSPGDTDCDRYGRYRWAAYKTRGLYLRHLQRWFEYFPVEQFLIIQSEKLFAESETNLTLLFDFLGLKHRGTSPPRFGNVNPGRYGSSMEADDRSYLEDYFRGANRELCEVLGRGFDWAS